MRRALVFAVLATAKRKSKSFSKELAQSHLRVKVFRFLASIALIGSIGGCINKEQNRSFAFDPERVDVFCVAAVQYGKAITAGLKLDEIGAGVGPVTGVATFTKYRRFYYLPIEAEPLISPEASPLLSSRLRSADMWQAKLARVCLDIVQSKRKIRHGQDVFSRKTKDGQIVFQGSFVLYHYD